MRKASRAEWVMPGESFLREASRLMRIPAIPIKWSPSRILRASSMCEFYRARLSLIVTSGH